MNESRLKFNDLAVFITTNGYLYESNKGKKDGLEFFEGLYEFQGALWSVVTIDGKIFQISTDANVSKRGARDDNN